VVSRECVEMACAFQLNKLKNENNMKKAFIALFMLLPILSDAQSVEIDGIYYNLITKAKQAEVTTNPNKYTGHVVIPASVTYNGVEHSVTSIGQRAFFNCGNMTSITIPSSVTGKLQ